MKKKKPLSMNELFKSGDLYWIDSLPTLKRWVLRDLEGNNVLKTIVMQNNGRGTRYYFIAENIPKFIKAFEQNELSGKLVPYEHLHSALSSEGTK